MDLPLHLIILGINTYIFSTIYFHDQHDPIPPALLSSFIIQIKRIVTNSIWPKLPSNKNLWNIPRKQGGMGLMDLSTQLKGRRAFFILYTLDPQQSNSNHPYLSHLFRLYLQLHSSYQQYKKNTLHQIQLLVNENINAKREDDPVPPPTSYFLPSEMISYHTISPWLNQIFEENEELNLPVNYSIDESSISVLYSLIYREYYRQERIDAQNLHDLFYLQLNIIPLLRWLI